MPNSTKSHQVIAAATRLRDAWASGDLDVVEIHEAALGLMTATGTDGPGVCP